MKDLKIFTSNIEDKARKQIDLLLEQEPFKDCKISHRINRAKRIDKQ